MSPHTNDLLLDKKPYIHSLLHVLHLPELPPTANQIFNWNSIKQQAHLCTNAIELVTKHTKDTMTIADKSMADISLVKTVNYTSWYSFLRQMLF